MASAWSQSAEAYSRNFQRGEENQISFDMSVGRQAVVANVVNALADKVVQGPVKSHQYQGSTTSSICTRRRSSSAVVGGILTEVLARATALCRRGDIK